VASIIVRVPNSTEVGTTGNITISAVAQWLGQTGAAAIKQARDFDFLVEIVSETAGSEEIIIGEQGTAEVVSQLIGIEEETIEEPGTETGEPEPVILRWLPVIIAAVIVISGAIFIPLLVKRRHA
jgi:hypothetical protein